MTAGLAAAAAAELGFDRDGSDAELDSDCSNADGVSSAEGVSGTDAEELREGGVDDGFRCIILIWSTTSSRGVRRISGNCEAVTINQHGQRAADEDIHGPGMGPSHHSAVWSTFCSTFQASHGQPGPFAASHSLWISNRKPAWSIVCAGQTISVHTNTQRRACDSTTAHLHTIQCNVTSFTRPQSITNTTSSMVMDVSAMLVASTIFL